MDDIEAVARALCRDRIRQNLRFEKDVSEKWPAERIDRAEDAGWENFKSEAAVAVCAIDTNREKN